MDQLTKCLALGEAFELLNVPLNVLYKIRKIYNVISVFKLGKVFRPIMGHASQSEHNLMGS